MDLGRTAWLFVTRRGLLLLAVGIFSVFAAGAVLYARYGPEADPLERAADLHGRGDTDAAERILVEYLTDHKEDKEAWRTLARNRGEIVAALTPGHPRQGQTSIHPRERTWPVGSPFYLSAPSYEEFIRRSPLGTAVLDSWFLAQTDGFAKAVERLAPKEHDFESLAEAGDIAVAVDEHESALQYYEKALAEHPTDSSIKNEILHTLVRLGYQADFQKRMEDPAWRADADLELVVDYHEGRHEYGQMIVPLLRYEITHYSLIHIIAATFTGLAWGLFLIHCGRLWKNGRIVLLGVLALFLGAASTQAVVLIGTITNNLIGFESQHKNIVFNFLYAVMGIGLREEVLKLMFFLPVAFLLRRNASSLQVLMVASMAGLGFAIEENIGYYRDWGGSAVVGRFLSANFLHLSLTGYAGYLLVHFFRGDRNSLDEFSSALVNVIFFHGLYDFVLIDETFQDVWFLSTIVFLWVAQQYLRLVVLLRGEQRADMPLSAVFVMAMAASAGTGYALLVHEEGALSGLLDVLIALVGLLVVAVVFFREFDDRIA